MNRRESPPNRADGVAVVILAATAPWVFILSQRMTEEGKFWRFAAAVAAGSLLVVFIVVRRAIRRG